MIIFNEVKLKKFLINGPNYPTLDGRAYKVIKRYLENKLGQFANTRQNNKNVHGFVGWKLN